MLMRHLTFPFAHGHKFKRRKKYFILRSYNVSSLPFGCFFADKKSLKQLKNNSLSFYFYIFQRHNKEPTDPEPLIVSAGT